MKMKNCYRKMLLLTVIGAVCVLSLGINTAYGRRNSNRSMKNKNQRVAVLNQEDQEGIIWMRSEEKLARDVYITLGKQWDLPQFKKIARSEQKHMNALKRLLVLFNLTDPIEDNTVGVFPSTHFQDLYDDLTELGSQSAIDALIVGATIEDLDIKDLQEFIIQTTNTKVIETYENLLRGSRNHLRAFVKGLEARGETYTPQYISQEEFDEIISTPTERGGKRGKNGGKRGGRRRGNR